MATTKKKPDVGDLFVHDEQSLHLHANIALFNFDGEEVTFGFGNRRFKDRSEVDIHSYIHLSVPHFVRLHRLMTDMMNKLTSSGQLQIDVTEVSGEAQQVKGEVKNANR